MGLYFPSFLFEMSMIWGFFCFFFFLAPFMVTFFVENSPYDIELILTNFIFAVLSSVMSCCFFSVLFGFSLFMAIGAGVLILLLFAMALMPGADSNSSSNFSYLDMDLKSFKKQNAPSYTRDEHSRPSYMAAGVAHLQAGMFDSIGGRLIGKENYQRKKKVFSGLYSGFLKIFWFFSITAFLVVSLFYNMDFSCYFKNYSFSENVKCSLDWPFFCTLISIFLLCGAIVVIDVCGVCSGALVGGSWKGKSFKK